MLGTSTTSWSVSLLFDESIDVRRAEPNRTTEANTRNAWLAAVCMVIDPLSGNVKHLGHLGNGQEMFRGPFLDWLRSVPRAPHKSPG